MYKPLENVGSTLEFALMYLQDGSNSTPNHLILANVSAQQLLNAIIEGKLVVCEIVDEQPPEGSGKIEDKSES